MTNKWAYDHQFFLALERWFRRESRDLPWRRDRKAYSVWISEVMLQQTQVSTVIGYYHRWMRSFPDVKSLSLATQDDVLLLWQGLGYYRRAVAIHDTAKILAKDFHFELPDDLSSLMRLPGIGRYTASAILSFAFHQMQPMVEVNIARVLHRVFFPTQKNTKDLWEISAAILPPDGHNAALMNEALMELGAKICLVREPLCHSCPLANFCRAFLLAKQKEALPTKEKKVVQNVASHVFLLSSFWGGSQHFAVLRRTHASRQKNLWCFPTLEHVPFDTMMDGKKAQKEDESLYFCPNYAALWQKSAKKIVKYIREGAFQDALMLPFAQNHRTEYQFSPLFSFTHRYTRFKVKIFVWDVILPENKSSLTQKNPQNFLWVNLKEMEQLAMPVHHQSIKKYLFSLR